MSELEIKALSGRIEELEARNTMLELKLLEVSSQLDDEDVQLEEGRRQLRLSYLGTIQAISRAIEAKDPHTQGHSELVTKYSMALARETGCSWTDLERIQMAAMLLDVGKIGIPRTILTKTDPLTPEEQAILQTHVEIGAKILEPIIYPWEIASLVYQHHERIDGSGYPRGLVADRIAPMARILGLVDAFCAMITERAYRSAHAREDTLTHIRDNAGILFDAEVVAAFDQVLARGEKQIFRELSEFAGRPM